MKSIMISIQPKWCELIANGKKTIEIRKTRPRCDVPFKCYIYCTKPTYPHEDFITVDAGTDKPFFAFYGGGKVIGEFICDEISKFTAEFVDDDCYEDIRYCYTTADDEEDEIIISTNEYINPNNNWLCNKSHLSFNDIKKYIGTNFHEIPFYGWHISNLQIYANPKELSNFIHPVSWGYEELKRPPQSWCYVEGEE